MRASLAPCAGSPSALALVVTPWRLQPSPWHLSRRPARCAAGIGCLPSSGLSFLLFLLLPAPALPLPLSGLHSEQLALLDVLVLTGSGAFVGWAGREGWRVEQVGVRSRAGRYSLLLLLLLPADRLAPSGPAAFHPPTPAQAPTEHHFSDGRAAAHLCRLSAANQPVPGHPALRRQPATLRAFCAACCGLHAHWHCAEMRCGCPGVPESCLCNNRVTQGAGTARGREHRQHYGGGGEPRHSGGDACRANAPWRSRLACCFSRSTGAVPSEP